MADGWQNRIVGHGNVPPESLTSNPMNWRQHPQAQRDALESVLDGIGWVQDVIVNKRTGLVVDGHARIDLAIERGEATVPCVYVDLSPDEERLVLATLDPIGAMAETGSEAMAALLEGVELSGPLAAMLSAVNMTDWVGDWDTSIKGGDNNKGTGKIIRVVVPADRFDEVLSVVTEAIAPFDGVSIG